MVKGSGSRRSDSVQVPSREDGAIAKNPSQGSQVRRNCPWTEAEHRLFLLGLDEYGRGAWRAIAAEYVGTRTATQVASHAQKYFLREGLPASRREKKRPSIHDIRSASEAPCMTTEERIQLRNSLQLMNRESMESIDTSAMEGVRGHRHSASAALGRSTRLFAAETGSSGEASTAAGDKNACSSKRKSSEEDLVARSELMWQSVPDQSIQAADTNMHGTSRRRTMDATQRADWQSSALFNPTATAATLPHEFSSSSPFQEQEASALGMIQPADTFEVARAAAAAGGTMLPIGLHRLNGSFGMGMPAQGPPPAHIQNPSLSAAALGHYPPVGMAGEFPAAYPVRHSLSDTRSSLYEDVTLDAPPPMADRLGWSGPFPMGQVGMYGQAVAPSGGASGGFGCPECDLLHCACTRRHSDVRPMSVSTQQGPSQVQAQGIAMPSSFLPSSLTMQGTAADTIQQSSATFMVNPQSEAMSQQDLFAPAAQPTEPVLAFGSAPAGMSYVPSLEDFRLLPPTSDRPEEPLMSTPDQEDAGFLGMENMNEDYMEI